MKKTRNKENEKEKEKKGFDHLRQTVEIKLFKKKTYQKKGKKQSKVGNGFRRIKDHSSSRRYRQRAKT